MKNSLLLLIALFSCNINKSVSHNSANVSEFDNIKLTYIYNYILNDIINDDAFHTIIPNSFKMLSESNVYTAISEQKLPYEYIEERAESLRDDMNIEKMKVHLNTHNPELFNLLITQIPVTTTTTEYINFAYNEKQANCKVLVSYSDIYSESDEYYVFVFYAQEMYESDTMLKDFIIYQFDKCHENGLIRFKYRYNILGLSIEYQTYSVSKKDIRTLSCD